MPRVFPRVPARNGGSSQKWGNFGGSELAGKLRDAKKLTAALLNSSLAPGRYHDGGNLGLFLRVESNGAKFWVQRISVKGKLTKTGTQARIEMGLGSYPLVALAVINRWLPPLLIAWPPLACLTS